MRATRLFVSLILVLGLATGQVWAAAAAQTDDRTAAQTQVPDEVKKGQGQPTKERQFVYSLSPWTGREFGGTFASRQANTIYFIADKTNIINSLRSEVYYWDITQEYMADWFGYKEEVPGKLEVLKGGSVFKTYEKTDYVYSYPDGYDGAPQLITGPDAVKAFKHFETVQNNYWDATSAYYDAQAKWQATMDKMLQRVQKTGKYYKPSEIPPAPVQPVPPKLYVTSPVQAFVINLPAGNYRIRLLDKDGKVVKDSEKKLVVFAPRRKGVGFDILPESTWTQPIRSDDKSHVLYLEGKRIFYISPWWEGEYNFYNYAKMSTLHKPLEGLGTKSAWNWVHTTEITTAKAQILKDGKVVQTIERKPYYVEQTPGYALGYKIEEFKPDPNNPEAAATFSGYRVELEAKGLYQLRFVDKDGNVIPGSERDIRSVRSVGWPLYTVPMIPLLVGLVVFFWRRSLKSKLPEGFEGSTVAS